MRDAIVAYLKAVETEYKTGIAREHAYRPALETLLEAVEPGLNAVNDPKQSAIGAPDFVVLRGETPIGILEAKDIGVPLDGVETGEQLKRYHAMRNVILTDYLEFRWYVDGEKRQTVRIADGRVKPDSGQYDALAHLLSSFMQTIVPTIHTAQELARRMANLAQLIRELIFNDLESDDPSPALTAQRDAFQKTLLPDISNGQFADMYAQTITYGLFAARINFKGDPKTFSRRGVSQDIPRTNPFLRKLFGSFEMDLGERVTFLVDAVVELLAHTDTDDILKDFGKATRQQDPMVHFYETFLAAYDPALREQRGVYYTPEPVVSYIVRSVDHILRERFGRGDGLGDTDTMILDPAAGTATFLYFVIQHIYETMFTGQAGMWDSYVGKHLLKRIFGFELLMAPYAVAHMKLGLLLQSLGYKMNSEQRLGVYLTNTLEEATKTSETLFSQFISAEANEAARVKRDEPIMVVLGNPPYSGYSANKGAWIESLMEDYKVTVRKEERQIQRLSNDYVKFIRFAQWRIEQTGEGMVSLITDNSYLTGILFRDMRKVLLDTFSDIYIFNLHGTALRGPSASVHDENVFDITQGVAIGVFIKFRNRGGDSQIHYAEIKGTRTSKYEFLLENDISSTDWQNIEPHSPYWRFVPTEQDAIYESWPKFTEIIGTGNPSKDRDHLYGTGIKTRHDHFVIGWDTFDAVKRVKQIANRRETDRELIDQLNLCTTNHFDIKKARVRAEASNLEDYVEVISFRPFDKRYGCSDPKKLDTKMAWLILTSVQAGWPTSPLRIRQA